MSKAKILRGRSVLKKRDTKDEKDSAGVRHEPAFVDAKLSSSIIPKEIKQKIAVTRQMTKTGVKQFSRDLLMMKKKISRLSKQSFEQIYSLGRKIQRGSFGDVHRVSCK